MKKHFLLLCMFFTCLVSNAQQRNVTGVVTDTDGEPLIGAAVLVVGTGTGGVTDFDGEFTVSVSGTEAVLHISYVGFQAKDVAVGNNNRLKVILESDAKLLDEVVVVGYATQKRANLIGAVGSIDSRSIENKPITSASQSLAGKIAGVHIAQSSGIAGADGAEITIRGLGTLNNTAPLILIDGVIASSMDIINPTDIDNISVLKDAASASIYGSQAANGVILITTKKGGDGKTTFNFNAGYSWSKITSQSKPEMVTDTEVFMTLMNEARVNSGLNPAFTEEVMEFYRTPAYRDACSTDWFDEIFKTALTQEYNISARGGNQKTQYYLSLGYMKQGSIVSEGEYERIAGRINLESEILPKLRIGANFGYTYGDQRTPNGSVSEVFALDIMRAPPLNPAYTDDGVIALPDSYSLKYDGQVQSGNPLVNMFYNEIHQTNNDLTGSIYLNLEVIPGLNVRANFNTNIELYDYSEWKGSPSVKNWRYKELLADPNLGLNIGDVTSNFYGMASLNLWTSKKYRINPHIQMDYAKSFNGHNFNLMLAGSYESNRYDYFATGRGKYDSNYVKILDAGDPTTLTNNSRISRYAVVSQFGRLNYNYKSRYLFEANVRRDGSSRFGKNHRYGIFPSFSLGWVLTEEAFMKKVPAINFLKLRGSWGQLGNQGWGDDFPYISKITYSNAYYVWGNEVASGAKPSTYGNPDLHWETTNVTNIGFNLHLFNSELTFEGDYFLRKTKDILFDTPLPYETGFSSVMTNLAQVENQGFELAVNYTKKLNDLDFSIGANTSYIKNKVNSLNPDLSGETDRHISGTRILQRNHAINSYYMLKWTGKIYQTQEEVDNSPHVSGAAPGDLIFEDISGPDGAPDGVIDSYDRQIMGTQYPSWTFGANLSVGYKGFRLSADLQGIADGYSYGICEYFTPTFQGSNFGQHWVNRWTPDNPSQTMPRLWVDNGPNTDYYNTYFLMDRSYLRLKNVTLSYDFPSAVFKKLMLNKLRVYVSASNIYTWTKDNYTGFDPERSNSSGERGGIPQAMSVKMGIDLTF